MGRLAYLVIEEAVDQVDVHSLKDVDAGKRTGNHWSDGIHDSFNQKEAKAPRTAQNEHLSNVFKGQHLAKTTVQNDVTCLNATIHLNTLCHVAGCFYTCLSLGTI